MTLINHIIEVFEQNGNVWMTPRDICRALEDIGRYDSECSCKRRINEQIDYLGTGEKPDKFEWIDMKGHKYRKYRLKDKSSVKEIFVIKENKVEEMSDYMNQCWDDPKKRQIIVDFYAKIDQQKNN